jgi:para-nitrobenzyl esterase
MRAAAASRPEPVRRYLFAHAYSNGPNVPFGAGHAMDVPFELHNLGLDGFTPSASELALSDQIVGYWVRFAATGDPDGAGAPSWPVYDVTTDPAIVLDDAITAAAGAGMAACDFWDSLID